VVELDSKELTLKAHALSDENRVKILAMLSKKEECACVILDYLGITQPTLSYHMRMLTDSGLVKARRAGKWAFYSLNRDELAQLSVAIGSISGLEMEPLLKSKKIE
jgi:ArsR family transcriptional regulator